MFCTGTPGLATCSPKLVSPIDIIKTVNVPIFIDEARGL
jgi:hypothetical protein